MKLTIPGSGVKCFTSEPSPLTQLKQHEIGSFYTWSRCVINKYGQNVGINLSAGVAKSIVVIRNSVLNGKPQLIEGDKQSWPISFY